MMGNYFPQSLMFILVKTKVEINHDNNEFLFTAVHIGGYALCQRSA